MDQYYGPSEIADQLNIQPSTLRKYSLIMEKAGYRFVKGENGKRFYRDIDVITLKRVVAAKNSTDMSLEQLIYSIISENKSDIIMVDDTPVERYGNDIAVLLGKLNNELGEVQVIKDLITVQSETLDKQSEQISELLEVVKVQNGEIQKLHDRLNVAAEGSGNLFTKLFKKNK